MYALHRMTEDDRHRYGQALDLPLPAPVAKRLRAALTAYDTVLTVHDESRAALARAEDHHRTTRRDAPGVFAELCRAGNVTVVPVELLQAVTEAGAAVDLASMAVEVAGRAISPAVTEVQAAFMSWDASVWLATARATAGPDGHLDDDGLTIWVAGRQGPAYVVPPEATEARQADGMARRLSGVPGPVGPEGARHPDVVNGRYVNGFRAEITRDAIDEYDAGRYRRLVQYWALCAIADGQARYDETAAAWRISAEWRDRSTLMAKYAPVPVLA